MTARKIRLPLLLSLALAICAPGSRAQEAAEATPAETQPAATEKPAEAEPATTKRPTRAKAKDDDDDDKPARTRRVTRPTPAPAPMAVATPMPRKQGFFSRLLGRKPAATPAPVATPTPKPRKVRKDEDDDKPTHKVRKDDDDEKPRHESGKRTDGDKPKTDNSDPEPGTEETPRPKAGKTASGKHAPTSTKKGSEAGAEQRQLEDAIVGGDPAEIEKARYNSARAKAMADGEVRDLKSKADTATSEEEGRKNLRAYNRALYDKMRKLEPSISDRADRMEAAVLKRLESAPQ